MVVDEAFLFTFAKTFKTGLKHSFLIILFLVQAIKPIIPFAEYAMNYDYIAKVLCINKEKPKMHCNGKCYLAKMVAENTDTETEKELPSLRLDNLFTPVYFEEITSISSANFFEEKKCRKIPDHQINSYLFSFTYYLFKPPIS